MSELSRLKPINLSTDHYDNATWDQIVAVVVAADSVWRIKIEHDIFYFESDLTKHLEELDEALARCPGTSAWHAEQEKKSAAPGS